MSNGLRARYIEDANFALDVKLLTALAFVKPEHIRIAYGEIRDEYDDDMMDMLVSFERTYIGYYKVRSISLLFHDSIYFLWSQ